MHSNRDLITKFEAYLLTEKRVAANTFSAYKRDIAQLFVYLEQEKKFLVDLTVKDLKNFLRYLKGMNIGARSIGRKISALKLLFAYLHERFDVEDKTESLIFPKIKQRLPSFLTQEEIEALLHASEKDTSEAGVRNKTMLYLLYVTGMRISELVMLKTCDIHFDTGFITVHGKGNKERMVPIPVDMLDLLRHYVQHTHAAFTSKNKGRRQTDYLFPTVYAGKVKPITRQAFWLILNSMWKLTGIQKTISPHQLRHSLATHMLKNGVNIRSLQLLLGHESIATVQIYTHVEVSHVREVYDKKHPRSQ
jgi:site-specific recombinase XerD